MSFRWQSVFKELQGILAVGMIAGGILLGLKSFYQQYNAPAAYRMGLKYMQGLDVPKDTSIAAEWFTRAANLGNADSQIMLGLLYQEGNGVSRNYAEAAKWFRKAAEQGNTEAQNNMGVLFVKGTGVPQDYIEAAKWFREAAEHRNPRAQMNLGALYANGHGLIQDWQEAYFWMSLSGLDDKKVAYAVKHLTPGQRKAADKRLENSKLRPSDR